MSQGPSLRNGSMFEVVIAMDDEEKVALANVTAGRLLNFDPAEPAGHLLLADARNLTGNFVSSGPRVKIHDSHRIQSRTSI